MIEAPPHLFSAPLNSLAHPPAWSQDQQAAVEAQQAAAGTQPVPSAPEGAAVKVAPKPGVGAEGHNLLYSAVFYDPKALLMGCDIELMCCCGSWHPAAGLCSHVQKAAAVQTAGPDTTSHDQHNLDSAVHV